MNLTPSQQLALDYKKNILVEAGAGSGKTTLFVERYLKILIENPSISAQNIIALTFTKKAASECQFRIYKKLYEAVTNKLISKTRLEEIEKAPITTIHAFCSNLIKQNALSLNISPYFSVLTDVESMYLFKQACNKTIKKLLKKNDHNLAVYIEKNSEKKLHQDLQSCYKKQEKLSQVDTKFQHNLTSLSHSLLTIFNKVISTYKNIKQTQGYLDYSDLITLTTTLLQDQQLKFFYSNTAKFIMVDECQDIDPFQWNLITLLCESKNFLSNKKLFLVGDPKQCIYRFRGAKLSFFSNLIKKFTSEKTNCTIVNLQENFRTNATIINIVNPIFKSLFTNQSSGLLYSPLKPTLQNTSSLTFGFLKNTAAQEDEFYYIYTKIQHYLSLSKEKKIVILARQRKQCEKIFRYLKNHNIDVQTDKQKGFFSQQLIIDCYLLIKILIFPTDFLSWSSILQSAFFNFSQTLCNEIFTTNTHTVYEKIETVKTKYPDINELNEAQKTIKNWYHILSKHTLYESLTQIIKEKSFQDHINKTPNGHYQIEIFLSILQSLEANLTYCPKELLEILEFKLSMHDASFDVPQNQNSRVNIMTIHAAKGLEFNHVIIVNCHHPFQMHFSESCLIEDNFFHCNSNTDQDKEIRKSFFEKEKLEIIEEEKRLFYVACTRAKETLLLTALNQKESKTKNLSYLSFITTLPNFKEDISSVSFEDDSKTITIPSEFQVTAPGDFSKTNTPPTSREQPQHLTNKTINIKKTMSYTPSQLISFSKEDNAITLNSLISQQIGTLIHECIMFIITQNNLFSDLIKFCNSHSIYNQLNNNEQNKIIQNLQPLYESHLLAHYTSLKFQLEESITIHLNNIDIHARFDGISFKNTTATLLEIKTDKVSNVETLLNKYNEQLNIYSICLFNYYNIKKLNIILYSSFLNKELTYYITKDKAYKLEEHVKSLLKKIEN